MADYPLDPAKKDPSGHILGAAPKSNYYLPQDVWEVIMPGAYVERLAGDALKNALSPESVHSYEAAVNRWGRQLMGASTWSQVYSIACAALGPQSFYVGVLSGVITEADGMIQGLQDTARAIFSQKTLELLKLIVLAGMYQMLHPGALTIGSMVANPTGAIPLLIWAKVLEPFLGADMKAADIRLRRMMSEVLTIAENPGQLFGGMWDSVKKDYGAKWDRFTQLSKKRGLADQFEAGQIAGGVLLQVALTVWAIIDGIPLVVAGVRMVAVVGEEVVVGIADAARAVAEGTRAAAGAGRAALMAWLRRVAPELIKFLTGRDLEAEAAVAARLRQEEELAKLGSEEPKPKPVSRIVKLDPNNVRYSQKTVSFEKKRPGGNYTFDDIKGSMKKDGWSGDPVDVVNMPDGQVTSMDNTRIAAAREANAEGANVEVAAVVHEYNDPLTAAEKARFTDEKAGFYPSTWGEAIDYRISDQGTGWSTANPMGAKNPPRVTERP
jgi:hypothetical protein